MKRDDVIAFRKEQLERLQRMRQVGDYSAGAGDIRENAEAIFKLIEHLLERMR